MIVLDTSVIIKWFVSEEYDYIAEEIRRKFLLGDEDISIPEFSLIELTNVLIRKRSFNSHITKDAIKSIIDIGVNIINSDNRRDARPTGLLCA